MLPSAGFGRFAGTACSVSRLNKTNFCPQEFQQRCRFNSSRHVWQKPGTVGEPVAGSSSTDSSGLHPPPQAPTTGTASDETTEPGNTFRILRTETAGRFKPLHDAVRRIMRHVPHPVAIITATDTAASPNGGPDAWRGATVSSLNTVALVPFPVISFNIKRISSTYDAINTTGHFNVHFLSSNSSMAKLVASKFSRGNAHSPFHDKHGNLERFAPIEIPGRKPIGTGAPIIRSHGVSVPLRLHCTLMRDKVVEIGDHRVVFGRVTDAFHAREHFDSDRVGETPILVYANGGYNTCAKLPPGTKSESLESTKDVKAQAGASANAPVDKESSV